MWCVKANAQEISKDSIRHSLQRMWAQSASKTDLICDSLQLGKTIASFNALKNGKINYSVDAMQYETDDFSYLFAGKVSALTLYFKRDTLISKLYLIQGTANFILATEGLMTRLKVIPFNAGTDNEPLYVIESYKYTIREKPPTENSPGYILIANKKYVKSN